MCFWSYLTNGLHSSVPISGRLLVAPGPVPLHLTPGVTNTNQLDLRSSVADLRRQAVRDNKQWICELKEMRCGYLLHSSDGVSVAFNQTSSGCASDRQNLVTLWYKPQTSGVQERQTLILISLWIQQSFAYVDGASEHRSSLHGFLEDEEEVCGGVRRLVHLAHATREVLHRLHGASSFQGFIAAV